MLIPASAARPLHARRSSLPTEAPPRPAPVMWGRLGEIAVTDLIVFVQQTRKCGCLRVLGAREQIILGFHKGDLVNGSSDVGQRLGEALIGQGVITRAALEEVLVHQSSADDWRNLGQCLLDLGAATEQDISAAVAEMTRKAVSSLLDLRVGSFELTVGPVPGFEQASSDAPDPRLESQRLSTVAVLLEAARELDEVHFQEDIEDESFFQFLDDVAS